MSSSDDKPWSCTKCTYVNGPITLACIICGTLQDGTASSRQPVPAAASGPRAKSPAKVPAKAGTTPPSAVAPVPVPAPSYAAVAAAAAAASPPVGFKLPIKARLDGTVRQFQLDRWIYSSLVETTQRLFNITHCLLFYDDEPKGGAPNLVPIRNDIDFTAAVNASHAANRRTLKIVITVPAAAPLAAATGSPPLGPTKTSLMNIPTSASLFTPKPPSSTPPAGLIPVQAPAAATTSTPAAAATVTTLKPNPVPAAVTSAPAASAATTPAAPPTTTPIAAPSPSPSSTTVVPSPSSSSPSPSRVATPSVDPHAATAGEPTTRRISSSIPPRWRHTIDVVPRFALSNENATPTAATTSSTSSTPSVATVAVETKQDSAAVVAPVDAMTPSSAAVTPTSTSSLPAPELARTRSAQEDWEEVAAIGQWSALERGIRSIRSDAIIWQSATLLPSPADPKKMRVVALAGGNVLPDELLADIQKLHEVVTASLLEFAEEDPLTSAIITPPPPTATDSITSPSSSSAVVAVASP